MRPLLHHPQPFQFIHDPGERQRPRGLDLIAHQDQRHPAPRFHGLLKNWVGHQARVIHIDVAYVDVLPEILVEVPIDVSDCLFQRQRGTSTTDPAGILGPRAHNDNLFACNRVHAHLRPARFARGLVS